MIICTYMAHLCVFPPKEDSSVCPSIIFSEQEHIIFLGLFIKICNTPPCSPKYYCNIWMYSTLMEAKFNGTTFFRTSTWMGKHTQFHGYIFILSVIKSNHKRGCHLFHLLYPVSGERNILSYWVILIKGINIVNTKHVPQQ